MPIEMNCPHCGARMRAPDGAVGKKGRCANPACKRTFIISVASKPSEIGGWLQLGLMYHNQSIWPKALECYDMARVLFQAK